MSYRVITRFKITLLILSTICIFLLITACSKMFVYEDNNPTVAWEEFCGYISDGDYRGAIELTGNYIEDSSDTLDDGVEGLMLTKLAENIDMRVITEPKVNGTGAWQSVRITHIDMSLLMQKVLNGVMRETTDYEWNHGSYKTDKKIAEAVKASLSNQLSGDLSDCLVTDVVKVEFRYKDGKWKPVMNKALYNAITGNASEAAASVDSFFADYGIRKSSSAGKSAS